MSVSITEDLKRQFDSSWRMLREGIAACPETEWRTENGDVFFVPARLAFHVIQTVDFYASACGQFDWQRFGFNWENARDSALPEKTTVLDYLDEVDIKSAQFIDKLGVDGLTATDEAFGPHHACPMERLIYALRHSHHHIGQLSLELQRRNLPEISWQ
jgi:uncharacterized damage-inducible protein DinB